MKPLWTKTSQWASAVVALIVLAAAPAVAIDGQDDERLVLLSLEFGGGTALDYIASIRRAAGDMNIVVAPEADQVRMPPVKLAQVTVAAALDLLDGRSFESPGRAVQLEVRQMPMYDPAERQIYQVVADVMGFHQSSHTQIWTVSALLANGIPSEAVLSAVEMALEVVGSSTELDTRFHEDTGLLIARGDREQLEVINEVLDRLNESAEQNRENELREWDAALSEVRRERDEAWGRLEQAEAEMHEALEEAAMFQEQMARLEVQVAELQRMLEANEHELAEVSAALRETQAELDLERRERAQRAPERERPND